MVNVPSTQTIIDTHRELKNLRLQINGKKSEKEQIIIETIEAQEGLTDVQKRSEELDIIVTELIELANSLVAEVKNSLDTSHILFQEVHEIINAYKDIISSLNSKIENQTIVLKEVVKKCDDKHIIIVKEREELEAFKVDLDIYKKRIEKIINDNNLDIKIL